MVLSTLLPENAEIVLRGGPGQEAWGHPVEPTAQYNHRSEGREKPPLCPWRIEVGDPNRGERTSFLHVFEVGDELDQEFAAVKLLAPAGVEIGERWRVQFSPMGPLGGAVDGQALATAVHLEAQYEMRFR